MLLGTFRNTFWGAHNQITWRELFSPRQSSWYSYSFSRCFSVRDVFARLSLTFIDFCPTLFPLTLVSSTLCPLLVPLLLPPHSCFHSVSTPVSTLFPRFPLCSTPVSTLVFNSCSPLVSTLVSTLVFHSCFLLVPSCFPLLPPSQEMHVSSEWDRWHQVSFLRRTGEIFGNITTQNWGQVLCQRIVWPSLWVGGWGWVVGGWWAGCGGVGVGVGGGGGGGWVEEMAVRGVGKGEDDILVCFLLIPWTSGAYCVVCLFTICPSLSSLYCAPIMLLVNEGSGW